MNIEKFVRPNILALKPYSSARDEFKGEANVFLDANENALGSPLPELYNRYPDPYQWQVKFALTKIKGVPAENIFLGNGSDEGIDLLFRIFCQPSKDNIIICPPTYGMYKVCADVQDIEVRRVNLLPNFQLNIGEIMNAADDNTKLLFLCSPNNPTGNDINREDIIFLLNNFNGIVVVDEAYINYSKQKSFIQELTEYSNLVVMQTLSKAWGLAALRVGMCFASQQIIDLFNKVKYPYNLNIASQKLALEALQNVAKVNADILSINSERVKLIEAFSNFKFVQHIYPSSANFILVKVTDATSLYNHFSSKGIVVRNRTNEPLCNNCLRITIGTPQENAAVVEALCSYK